MGKIIAVNKRCYPMQGCFIQFPYDPIVTTTVLVEGAIGDYAAYTGHGDLEWVAQFGDKLSFNEACCHFGKLEREKYRD